MPDGEHDSSSVPPVTEQSSRRTGADVGSTKVTIFGVEVELSPLIRWLHQRWKRTPVALRVLLIGLLVPVVGFALWAALRPAPAPPPPQPLLYSVRVVVLDPRGLPVEDSEITVSAGNEPQRVTRGWEVEIPRTKVPADGTVTLYATHAASGGEGIEEVLLGDDPTPTVKIRLTVQEATVRGDVLDPQGHSLLGARVSVVGFGDEALETDDSGTFELPAHQPRGTMVRMRVEHPDYPVKEGYCYAGTTQCSLRLSPHPSSGNRS